MRLDRPGTASPSAEDRADVQRIVAYPYDLDRSRHFVLEVLKADAGRDFLGALADQKLITGASLEKEALRAVAREGGSAVNIGITFRGLEQLELEEPYLLVLEEKAKAFAEGAYRRAGRYLADTGHNAAERWTSPFNEPGRAHLLLTIHADSDAALNACTARLRGLPGADHLRGWDEQDWINGCHLTTREQGRTAHFGFRDGIASPAIRDFYEKKEGRKLHEPGEFLLGYWNDSGFNPWLLVNPWQRPNPWLLPLNPKPKLREFFRNGSFGVFRKIEQNAEAFGKFVDTWAKQLVDLEPDVRADYVKAKLAGRWPDGRVVLPPEAEAKARASGQAAVTRESDLDDFDFEEDSQGHGCPFGAHIRRMNPRADRVVPTRRRPLIRRGMPYGEAFDKAAHEQRGLLGLFFCASIEDQFEFLLREWGYGKPMGPANRGTARDPLSASQQGFRALFDVPMPGEKSRQFDRLPSFLTTRGTLYAFYPGLESIRRIARRGEP